MGKAVFQNFLLITIRFNEFELEPLFRLETLESYLTFFKSVNLLRSFNVAQLSYLKYVYFILNKWSKK